jgi:Ser/Thr protein kinase RdoA (MazF antagonist)
VDVAPASAELLRFGTNAVYRLVGTPWVLRLRRPGSTAEDIERQLSVARWLVSRGYPANSPAAGVGVVADGLNGAVASFWEWAAEDSERRVDPQTFGRMLHELHVSTDAYPGTETLPRWAPIEHIEDRLASAAGGGSFLTAEDLGLLESWTERLAASILDLPWKLPRGLVHGDAHTGNVLVGAAGPVLIDFDLLCVGPREWDLVPTAVSSLRFDSDREAVERFSSAYGFDILAWAGWPTLSKLRELYMTSWLLTVATTPERQAEVRRRLDYWRAPEESAVWHAV